MTCNLLPVTFTLFLPPDFLHVSYFSFDLLNCVLNVTFFYMTSFRLFISVILVKLGLAHTVAFFLRRRGSF